MVCDAGGAALGGAEQLRYQLHEAARAGRELRRLQVWPVRAVLDAYANANVEQSEACEVTGNDHT